MSSERVDITMTAVLRPSIVKQTLESFCTNVFWKEPERFRLIVNIDPIGEKKVRPKQIARICRSYIPNAIFNVPDEPNFAKAVIWTWSQVEADWVFHLEDDWLIYRKIELDNMINLLKKFKSLACLRLLNKRIPNKKKIALWRTKYIYNKAGFFVAADRGRQFGLNPVLIRRKYIDEALPRMVPHRNPEKQFRVGNTAMKDHVLKYEYAIFGKPGEKQLVDGKIGYHWRRSSKFRKPRDGTQFLKWVERPKGGK